jgi:membrane protease YdiL (CAAX protease family)
VTYLISAWIVWIERNKFQKFNLDSLALIIFLIFRTFLWFTVTQSIYNQLAHLGFFIVAIILFINIRKFDQTKISQITIKQFIWLIVGAFIGFTIAIIQISFRKSDVTYSFNTYQSIVIFLFSFFYGLGNEAIDEEPLFRAFLWGYLRNKKWKERWIIFFQAGLFAISHVNYWREPYTIIIITLIYLLVGIMVWRSRSIATSMAFHAAYNSFATYGILLAKYVR